VRNVPCHVRLALDGSRIQNSAVRCVLSSCERAAQTTSTTCSTPLPGRKAPGPPRSTGRASALVSARDFRLAHARSEDFRFFYLSMEHFSLFPQDQFLCSRALFRQRQDWFQVRDQIPYILGILLRCHSLLALSGPRGVAGRGLVSSAGSRGYGWCCALAFCSDAASAPHDHDPDRFLGWQRYPHDHNRRCQSVSVYPALPIRFQVSGPIVTKPNTRPITNYRFNCSAENAPHQRRAHAIDT
jgi:hypothetical protein